MALPCAQHPGTIASFECLQCRRYACPACAKRIGKDRPVFECPGCGGMLSEMKVGVESRLAKERAPRVRASVLSAGRLLDCLHYLKTPSVLMVLGGLAMLTTLLYWLAARGGFLGVIPFLLAFGTESSIYFHIIERTAHGDLELEAPDMTGVAESIYGPAFRYLASIGPMLVAVIWFAAQSGDFLGTLELAIQRPVEIFHSAGPAVLMVIGVLLWPLFTLAGAMSQSVLAMYDPRAWGRTLEIMGSEYWSGVLVFYGVLALDVFAVRPVREWLVGAVPVPVIMPMVVTFIGYLPFALRARVLGAAAEPFVDQ